MSAVIDTTEEIVGEMDEASSHLHKVSRAVERGDYHNALEELSNVSLRIEEAEHLIRREMKK